MKLIALYFLILFPCFAFAQFIPEIGEFRGNIERVVESGYGKEDKKLNFIQKIFLPGVLSGWQFIYQFDKNSHLQKRTNTYLGNVRGEYEFVTKTNDRSSIEQEINTGGNNEKKGDYFECENIKDSSGKIIRVNYTAYSAKDNVRELYQTDRDPVYINGRLISFIREQLNSNGKILGSEKCTLFYDSAGRLNRFERKDLESEFTTVFNYTYNKEGFVSHSTIDFLIEIQQYGKKDQIQDIFYKYDNQGNWIRKYWRSGDKYILEAKRKIYYQ